MGLTWLTFEDMLRDTREAVRSGWLWERFGAVRCVIGVPRAGMIVASILAEMLGCGLMSVDDWLGGRGSWEGGYRLVGKRVRGRILIVDDTHDRGSTYERIHSRVQGHPYWGAVEERFSLGYMVLYGRAGVELPAGMVAYRTTEGDRLMEWSLQGRRELVDTLLDIDGVLCPDPPMRDEGQPEYEGYLERAPCVWDPMHRVGGLVTCRLERYRSVTESWLMERGIEYASLAMMPYATAEARRDSGIDYGRWKGQEFVRSGAALFIESDPEQAAKIATEGGKPVLCWSTRKLIRGELWDWDRHGG